MSESITRLAGRLLDHYLANRHLLYLVDDLNAIAAVANYVAAQATQATGQAAAAAASYTLQQSLGMAAWGVGTDGLDLPLTTLLGSAAFADFELLLARRPVTRDATYQILPIDFWASFLVTTSGTRTYTLPLLSDMPENIRPLIGKNRSGNNLAIARSGSDTIDAAATSLTVPTGSGWEIYRGTSQWESRVFA